MPAVTVNTHKGVFVTCEPSLQESYGKLNVREEWKRNDSFLDLERSLRQFAKLVRLTANCLHRKSSLDKTPGNCSENKIKPPKIK